MTLKLKNGKLQRIQAFMYLIWQQREIFCICNPLPVRQILSSAICVTSLLLEFEFEFHL